MYHYECDITVDWVDRKKREVDSLDEWVSEVSTVNM